MQKKKVKSLSDSQMEFIDQNWQVMTHFQMGQSIGAKECTVSYYCHRNDYRKAPTPQTDSRKLAPQEKTQPSSIYVPVKCLSEYQMKYILINHEEKNVRQMADHLQVEEYKISLFFQANALVPKSRWKYKRKDDYHLPVKKKKYPVPAPTPEGPRIVRAPGAYSNRSQADVINYYLKIA